MLLQMYIWQIARPNPLRCIAIHFRKIYICIIMERMIEHIEKLKDAVVAVFGQTLDAPTDYERLSADIQKRTGELISVSTLKRLFGYIKPGTIPRPSTLSVLARYVGSAGWSDFCSRCSMEEVLKSRKVSKKPIYLHPIVYIAITILCVGGVFVWLGWEYNQENTTESLLRNKEVPVLPSDVEETNEQKYERLLLSFVAISKEKCDSVRACRQNMDIISYKELVDSVYFPFVFTFLQDSIKRQVERTFPNDELLRVRYGNDIFAQCREICVELMREISSEELIEAYNKKK